jgi:hypothetical protein
MRIHRGDESLVDTDALKDNDEDDDMTLENENDDDDVEEEDIMEELARECSPVSACFSEVGTMAGEIYNHVEENLLRQDSIVKALEDNSQRSESSTVTPNSEAMSMSQQASAFDPTSSKANTKLAKSFDAQEVNSSSQNEGRSHMLPPPEEDMSPAGPSMLPPSLLGENLEDEDEDDADNELDFSNNVKSETVDMDEKETLQTAPTVVLEAAPEPEPETREHEDDLSKQYSARSKKDDDDVTNAILSSAALSAALLGFGPKRDLSEVPQDERLSAPEGVDPLEGGPISRNPSSDSGSYARSAYGVSASNTSSYANSSLNPMHPDDLVPYTVENHKDDANTSHDYTVGTEVNESREEGYQAEAEQFVDEEQPPVFEKALEFRRKRRTPRLESQVLCVGMPQSRPANPSRCLGCWTWNQYVHKQCKCCWHRPHQHPPQLRRRPARLNLGNFSMESLLADPSLSRRL